MLINDDVSTMLINDDVSMAKKSLWRDFVQTAVNPHLLRLCFFQMDDQADHDDGDDDDDNYDEDDGDDADADGDADGDRGDDAVGVDDGGEASCEATGTSKLL